MVDSPSFESAPRPKTPDMKTGAFPVLENRLLDIPDTAENFAQIQSMLSALPVSPERTRIEQNLLSVDEDMLDADIILLLKRAKEDILKTQTVKKEAQKTEVESKKIKIETQKTELDDKSIDKQKDLDKAQERIQALYASFGDQANFEKLNPNFQNWVEQAKENPSLDKNDPNLATKAQLLALQSHKQEIDASAQNLSPELRAKYAAASHDIFRGIESSLVDLRVTFSPSPKSVPFNHQTQISAEVVGYKTGDRITRTGNEYRIGDQVVDISTYPPTRSTELGNLRIEPTGEKAEREQRLKTDFYENTEKKEKELGNLKSLMASINGKISTETEYLNAIASSLQV